MLDHLVALADEYEQSGDLLPIGYSISSSQPIQWVIRIGPDGSASLREANLDRPRPKIKRTSGIEPFLLADYAYYVLGIPEEGKEERAKKAHDAFISLLEQASATLDSDILEPILLFYSNGADPSGPVEAIDPKDVILLELARGGDAGGIILDNPEIQGFWSEYAEDKASSGIRGPCSVCGEEKHLLRKMPEDIYIMGASPRPQLSSFNESAFTSYGREKTLNASICYACGERSAQALNMLTKAPRNRVRLARNPRTRASPSLKDQLAVFWTGADEVETEAGEPVPVDAALMFGMEGSIDEDLGVDVDEAQIERLLHTPWHANSSALETGEAGVHLVILSPNKARLVIRDWLHEDLEAIRSNLRTFLDATRVETPGGRPGRSQGVRQLLGALAVNGIDPDNGRVRSRREIEANQVRGLLRTAYAGRPPPQDIFPSAVRALRNPNVWSVPWLNQQLIAILHLNERWRTPGDDQDMNEKDSARLADENSDPGYLCGRLMAILEETQRRAADGQLNTTIVDRNYNAAATAPGSTLPRLLQQAETAHIPKVRKTAGTSTAEGIRSDLEAILTGLEAFPRTLDIKGQGQFALGFYHQRAEGRRKRREYFESQNDDETKTEAS